MKGLISRIRGRKTALTNQADTLCEVANLLLRTPNISFKSQIEIVEAYTGLAQRLKQTGADDE